LKTCKFSHGFWPGKAAHRAFKNDFRTADSGRKPHEVYQMVRKNSCELYGKAYDDLTKALTRAKWICRQNDDNLRLQSYRANPNLSFSNFRKRCGGRPKGSKNVKPRVKKGGELIQPLQFSETIACDDAISGQTPCSSIYACPSQCLSTTAELQPFEGEWERPSYLNYTESQHFKLSAAHDFLVEDSLPIPLDESIPKCWEFPIN
jgi:hypothetical protein